MNITLQTGGVRPVYTFGDSKKNKDKYQDPLLKWPVRGLAYSNELGAAISEMAPKLGTLLWFPAMLYFGADFYDKYKNEKTSYNPDAQRGTKQVIFQILASVILPTAAVIAGQKTASMLGVVGRDGLSLQTQEEIIKFLQKFSARRHIGDYLSNKESFKNHFEESLATKREKLVRNHKVKNPVMAILDYIFKDNHPEAIALSQKDRVLRYADNHINTMFKVYSDLVKNRKPKDFSDRLWKEFRNLKERYSKDPDYKSTYLRDAAEDVILKFQKNQIRNAKLMKTLGGFVALGLAIKPIDKFVENVIIKKYVEPRLSYVFKRIDENNIPEELRLD